MRSLYIGRGSGNVTNKIMAVSAGKIYSMTTAGVATERATGLSTTQYWDMTEGLISGTSRIVMVAPNNAPYQWDGSAASASTFTGPATNGDYCMYHIGKLWVADGDLRLVYMSANDNMTSWNSLDVLRIGKESDGPITRIVSMGRYFVCFMQKAVYLIYGNRIRNPRNVTIEQVDLDDGCVAPWSVTRVGNKIFWVGNNGFYVLVGREARMLTNSITAEFDSIDRSNIQVSQGGYVDNKWFVSVPHGSSATNTRTYCIHASMAPNALGEYPISYFDGLLGGCFTYNPGTKILYFGSQTAGFVNKYDTTLYSDDGAAVPYELITRGLTFGDQYLEKELTKVQLQLDVVASGTLVVSVRVNDSSTDVECPSATTAAPLSTASTGDFMGDYGGAPSWIRNGVVHVPLRPAVDGEPLIGIYFKARFYDSSTRNVVLRRVTYESQPVAR